MTFCRHLGTRFISFCEFFVQRRTVLWNNWIDVSSENIVWSQSSFLCAMAHSKRRILCSSVSIGFLCGNIFLYPMWCKCRYTVIRDNSRPFHCEVSWRYVWWLFHYYGESSVRWSERRNWLC